MEKFINLVNNIEQKVQEAYIKQEYIPGDVVEFDWGIVKIYPEGSVLMEYQMSIFTAAYSKFRLAKLFPKQNTQCFLKSHSDFFEYTNGSFAKVVYDNMRLVIKKFVERMIRYFYRIWDKFRYKYQDNSDIVGSAIYTYKGSAGKDKKYVYKLPDLYEDILIYNFRTMDVEELNLDNISDENPLKLVFKIAKRLLSTNANDNEIFLAKVELFNELVNYDKVKTIDQRKALTYFLEYLFLIQDDNLSEKFREIKDSAGGVIKMSIDEIREKYLEEKGKEEGREEGIELAKKVFKLLSKGESIPNIAKICKISEEKVKEILE